MSVWQHIRVWFLAFSKKKSYSILLASCIFLLGDLASIPGSSGSLLVLSKLLLTTIYPKRLRKFQTKILWNSPEIQYLQRVRLNWVVKLNLLMYVQSILANSIIVQDHSGISFSFHKVVEVRGSVPTYHTAKLEV